MTEAQRLMELEEADAEIKSMLAEARLDKAAEQDLLH